MRSKTAHVFGFSLLVAVMCACVATAARADTKTVTWTNAVQNTDGTAIAASGPGSLTRTAVEYGTCNAGKTAIATKSGEVTVAPPASALQLPLVVIQEFCIDAYHSNTFATTFGPGLAGNSAVSNVVVTQSNPPTPKPPGGVTVGNFIAYQIVQAPDNTTLLAFGHVAPGTPCDMTHSITTPNEGTTYLVPYLSVTLPNGTQNIARKTVYAACG